MEKKYIVGVDLGGTTVKLAFLTEEGDIVTKWEIPTNKKDSGKYIASDIAKAIKQKQNELNCDLLSIGMGVPGPVDFENGVVINGVNIGWVNFPIKKELQNESGLSVVVDNDANIAALGEMWKGAGNGAKDVVAVTLGTGVGGGVIANGKIVHGKKAAAGEIGHITSVISGGAPCNCGKMGCLETIASATGIARIAIEKIKESDMKGALAEYYQKNGEVSAKEVFAFYNTDEIAREVVEEISLHLGFALANVANTLNPEKIVIGGGVSKAGNDLLKSVDKYFKKFAFSVVAESTSLSIATLGNDAGVVGAAWLAKETYNK